MGDEGLDDWQGRGTNNKRHSEEIVAMPNDSANLGNGAVALLLPEVTSGGESLPADRCVQIHRIMVRTRAMEERMIKMSKSGQGHFWIGGPGEEAFNTCLGLQVKKGCGPQFDYLHLHYRNSSTLVAMGMPLIEPIRQMAMTATDSHSLGRNFSSHFARQEWNVIPVTSVIEVQYLMAPGTALVQKRLDTDAITIVTGGDAGTAEGDFASCLLWSTRPSNELPVLIIVTNNHWGISTEHCAQHSPERIVDRGKAFGIPGEVVDGNDVVASWHAIARAMHHVRTQRRPFMLEAMVSRLYGHSSSSGALRVKNEPDAIDQFEQKLLEVGVLDQHAIELVHEEAVAEVDAAIEQVLSEPQPGAEDVERYTYAPSEVDVVYPEDYTGLPA
jgi:2-oxoisovalerate dehydrogenase E1 component alpha subunit